MSSDRSGTDGSGSLQIAISEDSSSSDNAGAVTRAASGTTLTAADDTIQNADKMADESGSVITLEERVDTLETIVTSQTDYFEQFIKTTNCIKTLSGHVALLSRALCLMEVRYGVPANERMGQYLYKILETEIPPEMRQEAEDAGFLLSDDAGAPPMKKPPMYTTSTKRPATSPTSPSSAKTAKVAQYESTVFILDNVTYMSKEQPCMKTEGNLQLSAIEGKPGYMLHVLPGETQVDLGANLCMVHKQMQKGWPQNPTEQQYVDRITIYVQHIVKFCTSKVKLPIVVCGELRDDTVPGDTLKLFSARQGEPLAQMMKVASAATGLINKDKALILDVLRKVVVRLKLAQQKWATGSGRMDVDKPSLSESALDISVFDE